MKETKEPVLYIRRLGIDTYKESVVYISKNSHVCKAEGFEAQSRVKIKCQNKSIIATLNIINSNLLAPYQAGLSEYAWQLLGAKEGDEVQVVHAKPVYSFNFVHSKINGKSFSAPQIKKIICDIASDKYSDILISSFLTACAAARLSKEEVIHLTKTMIDIGDCLYWPQDIVVDKHCVGGLPANRTTPIIVAIVASFGLTMPKTSSRSITSAAGTADTMEVLAPVKLDLKTMHRVVAKEKGCIAWGGSVSLSPADDILIRIEKALSLDSEGQMVASILSKKISAGSTHILIDIPVGKTAKITSHKRAIILKDYLQTVGKALGVTIKVLITKGDQPIGRGIGPALEARDIIAVLKGTKNAPQDLRQRALELAAAIIEFSPDVAKGHGLKIATEILDSKTAWKKFQAICESQGGMRKIPKAKFTHPIKTEKSGTVKSINNRNLSLIAKLAGAPIEKSAGVDLHVTLGEKITNGQTLFTIHANSPGELQYVLNYLNKNIPIINIG